MTVRNRTHHTDEPRPPRETPSMKARANVLDAIKNVHEGKIYSLDSQWWHGMPLGAAHPPFQVLTYRSPRGQRNDGDLEWLNGDQNPQKYGFISEMVIGSMHSGTHVDALCHVTSGPADQWHGGGSAETLLGDFGCLELDAATFSPMITRGVLLDIPSLYGWDACPAGYAVSARDLESVCESGSFEIKQGDAVLIRTGLMSYWPNVEKMAQSAGAGVTVEGARWLAARGASVVGADTGTIEVRPSGVPGFPQPVHDYLIREKGIPLMEWVYLEELAADVISVFAFVCLPLRIHGATGSLVRPVAIT